MARRGKTVIKGTNQGNMMRALEQGEAAVHRASESLRQQENLNREGNMRDAAMMGKAFGDIQAKREAEANLDYERKFRAKKAVSDAALAQQRINLEAQRLGFEPGQGASQSPFLTEQQGDAAAPAPSTLTDRQGPQQQASPAGPPGGIGPEQAGGVMDAGQIDPQAQLEQRKADLRQQMQMSKPIEQGVKPPGLARSERGRRMDEQKASELEIKRMNAETQRQHARLALKKAQWKQDEDAAKLEKEKLQKPLNNAVGALNELMNGKSPSKQSMAWLAENTIGNKVYEDAKTWMTTDPGSLDEETKSRLIGHLKNQVDHAALAYAEDAEELPPGNLLDMTSQVMGQFVQNMQWAADMVKSLGLGTYTGVRTAEEKNRFMTSLGASLTRRGLMRPPAPAGPAGPEQIPTEQATNPQTGEPMDVRGLTEAEQRNARGIGLRPEHLGPGAGYSPAAGTQPGADGGPGGARPASPGTPRR